MRDDSALVKWGSSCQRGCLVQVLNHLLIFMGEMLKINIVLPAVDSFLYSLIEEPRLKWISAAFKQLQP